MINVKVSLRAMNLTFLRIAITARLKLSPVVYHSEALKKPPWNRLFPVNCHGQALTALGLTETLATGERYGRLPRRVRNHAADLANDEPLLAVGNRVWTGGEANEKITIRVRLGKSGYGSRRQI